MLNIWTFLPSSFSSTQLSWQIHYYKKNGKRKECYHLPFSSHAVKMTRPSYCLFVCYRFIPIYLQKWSMQKYFVLFLFPSAEIFLIFFFFSRISSIKYLHVFDKIIFYLFFFMVSTFFSYLFDYKLRKIERGKSQLCF